MAFTQFKHSGTLSPEISVCEKKHSSFAEKAAEEGIVLLKNESRSGSTIIGALLIGVSRVAAAEFTFFLAVPVMFGLSFLKIIKFGLAFSATELTVLVIGTVVAFLVSILVIKFLMGYIKKHDFQIFGWYRIVLGILVMLYFSFV